MLKERIRGFKHRKKYAFIYAHIYHFLSLLSIHFLFPFLCVVLCKMKKDILIITQWAIEWKESLGLDYVVCVT